MSAETPSSSLDAGIPEASSSEPATALALGHTPLAGQYYRVDSSRASYTELWRDFRSPLVLIVWLCKLLRIRLPGTLNDPNVVSLRPFLVADGAVEETVPPDVLQELQPVMRELTGLGFGEAVYFSIRDLFHHSRTCQVALLHRDSRSVARVTHRVESVEASKTYFFTEFLSALTGGTFLYSSTARAQSLVPAQCQLNWDRKATTSQLWVSHRQKLDEARQLGDPAVTMTGLDEMVDVLESHHAAVRDFQLERGVFSSMRGEDLAQAEALDKSIDQARSGQISHPDVMARIERLQKKQTSWRSGIFVLIVSIGLFIGAGMGAWKLSWDFLLIIVGILFVHEAGHYLAMRIFNYRNVRMFFIPFLGAAVSGQNFTAPGWKKVSVSLAGPLPGILLGGLLGIAGIIKGNDAMMRIAVMTVILNGLQLLPILPLDGGRVMQAVLFSRHYYLDTVFHVLTVGLLVGLAALTGDTVLFILGAFMGVGVPVVYKVAKIARGLRQQGFGPPVVAPATAPQGAITQPVALSPGDFAATMPQPAAVFGPPPDPHAISPPVPTSAEDDSIPQSVAEAIIERIRTRFPKLNSPKKIAELTLRVYETIVSRPAGIAASIGFLFLHSASFMVAMVLFFVLIVAQNPNLMDLAAVHAVKPTCSIDPDSITKWYGRLAPRSSSPGDAQLLTGPDAPAPGKHTTTIATFSTSDEARRAFDEVKQEAPASASLVYFGQSVLLSLPPSDESARMKWFDEFERQAEDVFIDGGRDFGAFLTLTCLASQAKEMHEQLSSFFAIPATLCLIPPWAGDDLDGRSEDERARHETARTMFCKLQGTFPSDAPELEALRDDMSRAARRNNEADYQRLSRQMSDLRTQLLLRELERIRDNETDPIARELADRYIAIKVGGQRVEEEGETADAPEDEDEWIDEFLYQAHARQRDELGPLMGRLPLSPDGGRPTPRVLRYSHSYGYAQYAGGVRLVVSVSFEDVSQGAPAFLKWLRQRGCGNFKYEFSSTGISDYYYDE